MNSGLKKSESQIQLSKFQSFVNNAAAGKPDSHSKESGSEHSEKATAFKMYSSKQ